MTTEQQVGIQLLNMIAMNINTIWTPPDDMADLRFARHKVAIKIPLPSQAHNAFNVAKNYLESYMEVAALDEPGEVVYQEFNVTNDVDPADNTFNGYVLIGLQRFIR